MKAALVYGTITALDLKGGKFYFLLMSLYHRIGKALIGPVWIMNPSPKERDILVLLSESVLRPVGKGKVQSSAHINIWKRRVSQRIYVRLKTKQNNNSNEQLTAHGAI